MSSVNCATDPRMAGQVRRFHTWPVSRTQTVGEHCWQTARILLAIHPTASRELILHALHHDTGEVATGDVPSHVKRENPMVRAAFEKEEHSAYLRMTIPWGLPVLQPLSKFDAWILRLADMMELWETGLQEEMMGNRLAGLVTDRASTWIQEHLTLSDPAVAGAATDYMKRRRLTWA